MKRLIIITSVVFLLPVGAGAQDAPPSKPALLAGQFAALYADAVGHVDALEQQLRAMQMAAAQEPIRQAKAVAEALAAAKAKPNAAVGPAQKATVPAAVAAAAAKQKAEDEEAPSPAIPPH